MGTRAAPKKHFVCRRAVASCGLAECNMSIEPTIIYATTQEIARRLKLSPRYLELLRQRGGGPPFISHGRAVRYAVCDVDAWAATLKRRSTSDQDVGA